MPEGLDIEVPDQDMLLNGGAGLAAHTGSCPLERPAMGTKHARSRAGSYMVSQDVETPSAAAGCSSKGQRHAQTPEEQSPEEGRWQAKLRRGWAGCENPCCIGTGLGIKHGGRRWAEVGARDPRSHRWISTQVAAIHGLCQCQARLPAEPGRG